ncbi:Cysteine synthase [Koleobacter methoxysyntrophicus]|uniref:Cysteine synthase n=1 Tax=Koleobacter methoxysyntrophicus TaxID=2751313 RepID=A0A8A0RS02_9FIRM|nr:cysteine synthase [Thermosediminibacterales bacterium]MDK2901339.1 cysteine synthase [Thermosediminibacterales bacterium]QSQ09966.1 Cysteine synthase [Koleobacter methoxysyntrophicus]
MVGLTPIVRLQNIVSGNDADVFAKLEFFNPGGSIKDRIALKMIEDAERKGLLKKDSIILEPTSGNTGIGLALVGASKGYKVVLVMPETMSIERRKLLKALGAEIILTPGVKGMKGAIDKVNEMVAENRNFFVPQQFENPSNPQAHRETTAEEILQQMNGDIDAFVSGVGTGGTITGVGEVLKLRIKNVKVIAVEPASSPVLSGGKPGPHKIQGIGAGFIPKILNRDIIDGIIQVTDMEAMKTSRLLAKKEGILAGISSGAALFAALKVAKELGKGKKVVVILPDTGERYLSTDLF